MFFHQQAVGSRSEPLLDHASKLRINLRSRELLQTRPSKRGLLRKGSPRQYGNWSPIMTQGYSHVLPGQQRYGYQPSPSYMHNVVIPLHKTAEPASSYSASLLSCSYSLSQSAGQAARSQRGSALSCLPPSSPTHATLDRYPSSTPKELNSVSSVTPARNGSPRVSQQVLRYEAEQEDLSKCRTRKRSSQIRPHRVDHMYYMSGTSLKLEPRYKVEDDELQRLRELSRARKRASYYGRGLRTEDSYMDVGHEPPKQPPPSSTGESEMSHGDGSNYGNTETRNVRKNEKFDRDSNGDQRITTSGNDQPKDEGLTEQVESLTIQEDDVVQNPSDTGEKDARLQESEAGRSQEHNTQLEDGDSGVENDSVKDSPVTGESEPGR